MNHDDAPTSVGPGDDPTTVEPPATAAVPELAWSLDDADRAVTKKTGGRQSWAVACGLAAVLLLVAVGAAVAIGILGWAPARPREFLSAPGKSPVPTAPDLKVVDRAPPPSPPPVVASPKELPPAPPPRPTVPAPQADTAGDQRMLASLRGLGLTIYDEQLVLRNAHEVCDLFRQGESVDEVNQRMAAQTGASMADVLQLTSSAMLSYPNCG